MFEIEIIDRYIHFLLYYFEINAPFCLYSLPNLNVSCHCGELIFIEGKLGRCLIMEFFFIDLLHFEIESESRFNDEMRIVLVPN